MITTTKIIAAIQVLFVMYLSINNGYDTMIEGILQGTMLLASGLLFTATNLME